MKHRVNDLLDAICSGEYNEHSVRSLFLDARSHAHQGSSLREIGDFLAHPDRRDRGLVHTRVLGTSKDLRKHFDVLAGRIRDDKGVVTISLCFQAEEVVVALCEVLGRADYVKYNDPRLATLLLKRSELALCILVLLQGAVFEIANQRPTAFLGESPDHKVTLLVRFKGEDVGAKPGIFVAFPIIQSDYPWPAYAPIGSTGTPAGTFFGLRKDVQRGFYLVADQGS